MLMDTHYYDDDKLRKSFAIGQLDLKACRNRHHYERWQYRSAVMILLAARVAAS